MPLKETANKFWSWIAYAFSGMSAFFGAMTLERAALIIGIITAVGTFAINWFYKWKNDRLVQRLADQSRVDCAMCEKVQGND